MIVNIMKADIFEVVNPHILESSVIQLTLVDQVASAIREWIFSGRFAPTERVHEEQVAETLGVSRGPVRDALRQLRTEGLVTSERNKGSFVIELSQTDLTEIYQLRTVLEKLAVELVIDSSDSEAIEALEKRLIEIRRAGIESDVDSLLYADIAFHQEIYIRSGSRRLFETWTTLRSQVAFALKRRQETTNSYRGMIIKEHQQILNLIKAKDKKAAVEAIEKHIRDAYERVTQLETPATGE